VYQTQIYTKLCHVHEAIHQSFAKVSNTLLTSIELPLYYTFIIHIWHDALQGSLRLLITNVGIYGIEACISLAQLQLGQKVLVRINIIFTTRLHQ